MDDGNYLKEVRDQYENYPYPMVDPELEKQRLYMPVLEAFDRLNYFCFSGKRNFQQPFRTLIAGGGTGDAVIALAEQLRDFPAEIIYVDMSEASMNVAQKRATVRGLTNITWIRDSLLNIPKLGLGQFDYINCSGVLHHLADPQEGLAILTASLKGDGAMGIMLYAKYGRMAVYQMQEMLRLLNQGEENLQARVDHAKIILNNLPTSNWFHQSPPVIIDEVRAGDIGIYDLLLHAQDRAYSIPELYEYVERAGLKILQLFSDDPTIANNLYDPSYYIKDIPLLQKVLALPLRDQQAVAELLHGKIIKHTFYAARTIPALPSPEDLEVIPVLGFDIFSEGEAICQVIRDSGDVVILRQSSTGVVVGLHKTPYMEAIFRHIDGKASLREIFRKIMDSAKKEKPNYQTLGLEFKAMFQTLNLYNWLFLRQKESAAIIYPDRLQDRVKDREPA